MDKAAEVLIVEDSPFQVKLLKGILDKKGYKVTVAVNGKEGLSKAKELIPDLIISDIQMPEMDGFEMCRAIKHDETLKHIPVILLTTLTDPKDIVHGLNSRADYYYTKPYDEDFLLARIEAVLAQPVTPEKEFPNFSLQAAISGRNYDITADPQQVLKLFVSVYENAIQKNVELEAANKEINSAKLELEDKNQRIQQQMEEIKEAQEKEKKLAAAAAAAEVEKKKSEELKKAYKELEEANDKLKESTVQLIQSEKLSALGELTAGVAHELKQPLNTIKIIGQSILRDIQKDRFEKESAQEDLPEIIQQVNKMSEIIDHMRIFTRKSESMEPILVNINDVVDGALKFFGQQLITHGIQTDINLAADLPLIRGDAIRMEQVLMNLITNARHAVESSGNQEKKIAITTTSDNGKVKLAVKDNGKGIPPKVKEKIFQPFFTTKEPGKGTGLGLSVSHKIIEEHGGTFKVESEEGQGTTFSIIIPAADEPE
ncbi:ATP-binding protein [Fibrobacterota bacterium]